MSCYFRHLKDIFDQAGIEVTAGNRKQVDQAIRRIAGTTSGECPVTWKWLKQHVLTDDGERNRFISALKKALE